MQLKLTLFCLLKWSPAQGPVIFQSSVCNFLLKFLDTLTVKVTHLVLMHMHYLNVLLSNSGPGFLRSLIRFQFIPLS